MGEQIGEYYDFIVQLYGATRIQGFNHLHGIKDGRMVHVVASRTERSSRTPWAGPLPKAAGC